MRLELAGQEPCSDVVVCAKDCTDEVTHALNL
jgi:hypothetical protein